MYLQNKKRRVLFNIVDETKQKDNVSFPDATGRDSLVLASLCFIVLRNYVDSRY